MFYVEISFNRCSNTEHILNKKFELYFHSRKWMIMRIHSAKIKDNWERIVARGQYVRDHTRQQKISLTYIAIVK